MRKEEEERRQKFENMIREQEERRQKLMEARKGMAGSNETK